MHFKLCLVSWILGLLAFGAAWLCLPREPQRVWSRVGSEGRYTTAFTVQHGRVLPAESDSADTDLVFYGSGLEPMRQTQRPTWFGWVWGDQMTGARGDWSQSLSDQAETLVWSDTLVAQIESWVTAEITDGRYVAQEAASPGFTDRLLSRSVPLRVDPLSKQFAQADPAYAAKAASWALPTVSGLTGLSIGFGVFGLVQLGIGLWRARLTSKRARSGGVCTACGYPTAELGRCPECGTRTSVANKPGA